MTPAHDPNDFTTGKRHSLEFINIFDDNGLINAQGGPFEGQPRFKVRGGQAFTLPSSPLVAQHEDGLGLLMGP